MEAKYPRARVHLGPGVWDRRHILGRSAQLVSLAGTGAETLELDFQVLSD